MGLLAFQVYDLIVFWELIQGSFTVKWYLPFLVISFSWIYVRRRIFEVRTLKIDALVGDEVRKLAHDLTAPIKNLSSLTATYEHDLISRNIKELESLTSNVLGKYNHMTSELEKRSQDNLHIILSDIKEKFKDKIAVSFDMSMEFDWYCVDKILFTRTFTNLITNSINANATTFEVNGHYRNNFLTINVSDNGDGIPKNLQPYIFKKGITSNKALGNGLGLSFVKEKFYELGFNIKLKKSSPHGSEFQIQIPLKEIVLIDDNPLVRDTWTALARKVGIQIKAFARSKDIEFERISKETPIFIDYDLGAENGLSTIQGLQRQGFTNTCLATGERKQLHKSVHQRRKDFPFFHEKQT
jgi:signal transduction histidine kinase